MKALILFVFLFTTAAQAQIPYTNDTIRVYPLIADLVIEGELRGFDLIPHITSLDSIIISKRGVNEYRWVGKNQTIELDESLFKNDWDIKRSFAHEIGHHVGVWDCERCGLNIMGAIKWSGLVHMYKNPIYEGEFYNKYFEALKDPKAHNDDHKHF